MLDTSHARNLSDKFFEMTAADQLEAGRVRRALRLAAIELRRLADEMDRDRARSEAS